VSAFKPLVNCIVDVLEWFFVGLVLRGGFFFFKDAVSRCVTFSRMLLQAV